MLQCCSCSEGSRALKKRSIYLYIYIIYIIYRILFPLFTLLNPNCNTATTATNQQVSGLEIVSIRLYVSDLSFIRSGVRFSIKESPPPPEGDRKRPQTPEKCFELFYNTYSAVTPNFIILPLPEDSSDLNRSACSRAACLPSAISTPPPIYAPKWFVCSQSLSTIIFDI